MRCGSSPVSSSGGWPWPGTISVSQSGWRAAISANVCADGQRRRARRGWREAEPCAALRTAAESVAAGRLGSKLFTTLISAGSKSATGRPASVR